MTSDRSGDYAAARSRDASRDGRLFIGVKPTGNYCRPICSARMPKLSNCEFFAHAAAAEKAGFRPCLVCRPELAPGDVHVQANSKLACLVLRRIEDGALNSKSTTELAAEFDLEPDVLGRLTADEFGLTPIEIASTRRLLHAKQLLSETDLSATDVAAAAGIENPRRLTRLLNSRYGLSPTALRREANGSRRQKDSPRLSNTISLRIDYRPPFNWAALLAFLGARAIPRVEAVCNGAYLRTVRVADHAGWVAVMPYSDSRRARPIHALRLVMSDTLRPVCIEVLTRMKTVFDTRANATEIDAQLADDPLLEPSVKMHAGMRLPGAFDGFELLLRAILGQQVSVKGATTLAGRMAAAFGRPIETPWPALTHLSPDVDRIARTKVDQIAQIGMPGKRAEAIRLVAKSVCGGELNLNPGADPDIVRERLIAFPGIGDWTASYVAMRALAWPDAFPLGDLGIKKALGMTRAADIITRTDAWRPWRAYAAIYLWLSLSGG